jgi:hypothetical protein
MPITFECGCGAELRVADEFAGKRAKCPSCEAVVPVPERRAEEPEEPRPRKAPTARRVAERDEEGEDQSRRREEGDDRPRFGKRRITDDGSAQDWKSKDETSGKSRSLEGKVANGGIVGGIVAMVIAVVWFVVGLAAGRIFFYPPILFIIGLVGFIKGLVEYSNREE